MPGVIISGRLDRRFQCHLHDLLNRIHKVGGERMSRLIDGLSEDVRSHVLHTEHPGDAGTYSHLSHRASVVNPLADAVLSGRITIDDIYRKEHSFEVEEGVAEMLTPRIMIAYHVHGIPIEQWPGWGTQPYDTKIDVSYILKVNHAITKLRPSDGLRSWLEMQADYIVVVGAQKPSIDRYRGYLRWMNRIEKSGISSHDLQESPSASWYNDDWSHEAVARFIRSGVSIADVTRIERQGVKTSEFIVAVLTDSMPIEWAIALEAEASN